MGQFSFAARIPTDRLINLILIRGSKGRAELLGRLGRFEESLEAWEVAVKRANLENERVAMRAARLKTVARKGDHLLAIEALEELRSDTVNFSPDCLLEGAMVHAQAHRNEPDVGHAEAAIQWLYDALEHRLFDNPHRLLSLRSDPFLDPLREVSDFKNLLEELE